MEEGVLHRVLEGNLEGNDSLVDPDVVGRIILKRLKGRDVQRILVGKPEGKRHIGETQT
jgi:hypothetical protein